MTDKTVTYDGHKGNWTIDVRIGNRGTIVGPFRTKLGAWLRAQQEVSRLKQDPI